MAFALLFDWQVQSQTNPGSPLVLVPGTFTEFGIGNVYKHPTREQSYMIVLKIERANLNKMIPQPKTENTEQLGFQMALAINESLFHRRDLVIKVSTGYLSASNSWHLV